MSAAKNWSFTINNYTEADLEKLAGAATECTYLVVGKEVGASGTPHLQCFASLKVRKRLTQVKQLFSARGHFEKSKGSPEQNRVYCVKDGDFVEYGTVPVGRGRRTDLIDVKTAIDSGLSREEVIEEFFSVYAKHHRFFDSYIALKQPARKWETENVVFWGKTGTGKTRQVYQYHEEADIYKHPGDRWFDGYTGQPIVLFDDFTGGVFPLSYLLQLMDRYPMRVPVKGGFVQWVPRKIYFTSNIDPKEWYMHAIQEHQNALKRRIKTVTHFQ